MRRLRWGLTVAAQAGAHRLLQHAAPAAAGATAGLALLRGHHEEHELSPSQRLVFMAISVGLVVTAGLMSGLTLGLMSMDLVELEVLKRSGTPREQQYAAAIGPIISNQHFLLVTLLLCNAVAMEALPLFLDRLADPVTAILISVTAVLAFGEILPQAVCSRYGLAIGYYCAWLVRLLMLATSPISWPIGKLLDFLLGAEHRALFRRGQLKALVDIHGADEGLGGNLTEDEIKVICGALDLTSKTARKSMTPLNKVFMLPADARLTQQTMRAILASGHSRIPVYTSGDRSSIIGLILVKELLQYKTHQEVPVSEVRMRSLPRLPADTPMYDMLKLFQTGRSHMVVLTDTPATARAAAAAAAKAKAAADAAEAASTGSGGSDAASDASSGGSPADGAERRKRPHRKKKPPQFESPLLQRVASPVEPEAQEAAQQAAAAAAAEQQQQQLQQQAAREAGLFDRGLFAAMINSNGQPGGDTDPHQQQQQQQGPVPSGPSSDSGGLLSPGGLRRSRSGSTGGDGRSRGRVTFREHGAPSTVEAGAPAAQPVQQQQQGEDGQEQQHLAGGSNEAGGAASGASLACSNSGGSGHGLHTRSKSGPMLLSLVIGQGGEQHIDVLYGPEGVAVPIGIITIEDVIEELMQAEIVDETDLFVDNERSITVNAAALAQGLPAQLRLALQSPQHAAGVGGVAGALAGAGAVRKIFRQRSSGTLAGGTAAGGAASGGSSGPGATRGGAAPGGSASGSGGTGLVVVVTSGLAAAAAVGGSRGSSGGGAAAGGERQPLLSPTARAAPSSHLG